MNAKTCLVLMICFMALCLVGCKSGEKQAKGPPPPVSEAQTVYPAPAQKQQMAQQPTDQQLLEKKQQMAEKAEMDPVYFATGKSQVTKRAAETLEKNAQWLKQNPDVKVEISGNADPRGSAQMNQKLAQKRADAVKQQLVQFGVDPNRIQTSSYGADRPVCTESSANCYAVNRRVDMKAMG